MKKKELEIFLQQLPEPIVSRATLEQYMTPASIAADIIFTAHQFGDIQHKVVVDLGCGTGIFSIGAAVTGAKKVIGIDIDKQLIKTAEDYTKKHDVEIEFITADVRDVKIRADTVIMNSPFGAQKSNKNADRRFLETSRTIAPVVYSLHLAKTFSFLEKIVHALDGKIVYQKIYKFPIKKIYHFHNKEKAEFLVVLLKTVF
ncbi:MAG: methyltransferase domain-containing protein [Candidatus Thermoplasmatota archaeon]|nr:methyltransferase domain-containing protein [Candidatus Thermoplasmatota archaeon]